MGHHQWFRSSVSFQLGRWHYATYRLLLAGSFYRCLVTWFSWCHNPSVVWCYVPCLRNSRWTLSGNLVVWLARSRSTILWIVWCQVHCLCKTGSISSDSSVPGAKSSWEVPLKFPGIRLCAESPYGRIWAEWNCHLGLGDATTLVASTDNVLNKIIVPTPAVVPCLPETIVLLHHPLICFSDVPACSAHWFLLWWIRAPHRASHRHRVATL